MPKPPIRDVRAVLATLETELGADAADQTPPEIGERAYALGAHHALRWAAGDAPAWGETFGIEP
jgi:hypothetical protein